MSEQETMQFGWHYMLDGYGADPDLLRDADQLKKILDTVPVEMGMHPISAPLIVVAGPNNKKDPGGLSGFVMIAESHISFHTFANRGFVTIDVYTCQDELDSDKLTAQFQKAFKFEKYDESMVARGTKYPIRNIH